MPLAYAFDEWIRKHVGSIVKPCGYCNGPVGPGSSTVDNESGLRFHDEDCARAYADFMAERAAAQATRAPLVLGVDADTLIRLDSERVWSA